MNSLTPINIRHAELVALYADGSDRADTLGDLLGDILPDVSSKLYEWSCTVHGRDRHGGMADMGDAGRDAEALMEEIEVRARMLAHVVNVGEPAVPEVRAAYRAWCAARAGRA